MPADIILVIDAGTSAMRAVRVALPDGRADVVAAEPWPMFEPEDAAPGGREYDGALVSTALARVVDRASADGDFAAVAVAGQREGVVYLDGDGSPLLVSPNIDARAVAEGMAIDAAHAGAVYAETGRLPSLMFAPAKLRWLAAWRPRDAERVRTVLPLADWLAMLLTGSPFRTRGLAVEIGVARVGDGDASPLLRELGFDTALLPPAIDDGSVGGTVAFGPLAGVPVVHAGGDTQCALAALGCRPGEAGVVAGWSAPVQLVTDAPVFDGEQRTWTGRHVVPGEFVLESNALETGRAWRWLLEMMGIDEREGDALAATSPPGARDALAVLGPRVMRAHRLSAGFGALTMPLPIVMTAPARADILRSAMEAVACSIRANLEQAEEISGRPADGAIGLGGGMSRSALFARVLADVLGRPVRVARSPESTALGAACLAAAALGSYASAAHAAQALGERACVIEPDDATAATYDDVYARWCAMTDAFERLAVEV